jgi:hypothetical protein
MMIPAAPTWGLERGTSTMDALAVLAVIAFGSWPCGEWLRRRVSVLPKSTESRRQCLSSLRKIAPLVA